MLKDCQDNDVNNLRVIHIAGTKGKGSTCAFARSFLREHGLRTGFPRKIGLYTSPHLRCIRERIQINDQPILEELFAKYFFEVWDRLCPQDIQVVEGKEKGPRSLQLLALVASHAFIKEEIEAAIFETHHGGEYDATNFVEKPIVTGITTIGLDHIAQLGPSIENIAWHKAGIFKPGTPAFSAPQDPAVASTLQDRAAEKGVTLRFVEEDPLLPGDAKALQVPVQRTNCSVALALVNAFLEHQEIPEHKHLAPSDVSRGIEKFSWAGRFEVIVEGKNQWFLDGAHNELSVKQAAEWFANSTFEGQRYVKINASLRGNKLDSIMSPGPRILIFSHSSEERDGVALLECLAHSLAKSGVGLDYVIFTTYQERQDGRMRIGEAHLWLILHSASS